MFQCPTKSNPLLATIFVPFNKPQSNFNSYSCHYCATVLFLKLQPPLDNDGEKYSQWQWSKHSFSVSRTGWEMDFCRCRTVQSNRNEWQPLVLFVLLQPTTSTYMCHTKLPQCCVTMSLGHSKKQSSVYRFIKQVCLNFTETIMFILCFREIKHQYFQASQLYPPRLETVFMSHRRSFYPFRLTLPYFIHCKKTDHMFETKYNRTWCPNNDYVPNAYSERSKALKWPPCMFWLIIKSKLIVHINASFELVGEWQRRWKEF